MKLPLQLNEGHTKEKKHIAISYMLPCCILC